MKEELEKEADKYAKEITKKYVFMEHGRASALGYLAGAESREKRIEELEQQIDFVRDERNNFQEKCEDIELNYYCDRKGGCKVQELEKENAELQALIKSEHEIEARKNNMLISQLTKAKDLIEDMYDRIPASHSDYYKDVMERARQFLWGQKND